MKILVTGATGFLGGWVLEMMSDEFGKENVVGTGRNPEQIKKLGDMGYKMVPGDLSDPDFVKKEFSDCTHVIHCAALSSPWGSYGKFYRHNVMTTQNLLKGLDKIERFILISTPTVYFAYQHKFDVKESDPLPNKFVNAYAATKYLAEQEVLNYAEHKDMIRAIIRPRAIIGKGDTVIVPRVVKAYNEGKLKIIGNGKNIVDFSSAKNIGHACILALKKDKKIDGKVFNITDGDPQELGKFMYSSLEKLGLNPDLKKIPYWLVMVIATLSEWFSKITTGKEPTLTRYGISVMNFSTTLDISEAKEHLGYKPLVNTTESIDEFVEWYREQEGKD